MRCLVLLGLALLASCAEPPETNPRQLIFISIDTLRADHLGSYGYPRATSPNIDALASRGALFENFFTVVPKTGPSMSTHFTGKYIQHHGVTENPRELASAQETLAELLPGRFRTGAFVANPVLQASRGYDAGFDDFELVESTPDVTDSALAWLEKRQDRSFFLWLHYLDPHGRYEPPAELAETFVGDDWYDPSKRVALNYEPEFENENYVLGAVPRYQRLGDRDEVDYYIAQYDAEILWIDRQIGRLMNYLKESGLDRRVTLVLTSDHGESLGEHDYYFEHGMLVNEGSVHIPMIVAGPGIEPRRIAGLAQSTDTLPTILTLLQELPPEEIDGIDLTPLIDGKTETGREFVYSCTPYPEYESFYEMYRTAEGKLVRAGDDTMRYFDLGTDPGELDDRLADLDGEQLVAWATALSAFGMRDGGADIPEMSDEVTERLRSLGYLD
ncbi:hypothetical protein ABI59_13785 [Acidobacteria bacterium Mor1]|nr:hypothetical protein ABI59_13785 [Acidobacteria bacterium Mor1]